MDHTDYRGSQIFISCPDAALRSALSDTLRNLEYEAYAVEGPLGVDEAERRDSLVFLRRSEQGDGVWFSMADRFRESGSECSLIALGEDAIPEGFRGAIGGPEARFEEGIVGYLGEFKARGHRRYVRFGNQNASIATFEFHRNGTRYAGIVHDISAAGCSCTFKPEPTDLGHVAVDGMDLNLPGHGTFLEVRGRFVSRRLFSGQVIHVFLFDPSLPDETVGGIHDFIYSALETKLSYR